jgi:hypothetical protein
LQLDKQLITIVHGKAITKYSGFPAKQVGVIEQLPRQPVYSNIFVYK